MNRITRTRRFTYLAMLSAMAIALHILETAILPPFFLVFRIGLANIISLVTVKILGRKETVVVNVMRVVIGSLLSGSFLGSRFWISAVAVTFSTIVILILDKMNASLMFTSVISSIAHSIGQVLVVMLLYMQPAYSAIIPYFVAFSIPTGLLTGFTANAVVKRVKPLKAGERTGTKKD